MLLAIIIAGVLSYATVGSWTFGYMAGVWAKENNHQDNYYYDEPGPWFAGIFWPITFLIFLFCLPLVEYSTRVGIKKVERRRVRIELEKRIRVEQEKAQQEIEAELEEELRNEAAA